MEESNKTLFEVVKKGSDTFNLKFQIIIIGESGVGKTCICLKHAKNSFLNEYIQTSGYELYDSDLKYKDISMKLQIYDTSGDDNYNSLISTLYKKTSLAIIVYSVDE